MDVRDAKKEKVRERIESIEMALVRAHEYLESGKHAHWSGFRPFFVRKQRDGKELPPHKDWVKNVFVRRCKRALRRAAKALERLDRDGS